MSQIQHTVLFRLPGLTSADQMATCQHLVTQFNDLAGIKASFAATGVPDGAGRVLSLEETVAALDWPDKTTGYSHCLLVIAADVPSLKAYLHSELHSQWAALVKPCADGPPLVFDSPLALSVFSPWSILVATLPPATQLGLPPPTCVRSERFHCRAGGGRRR